MDSKPYVIVYNFGFGKKQNTATFGRALALKQVTKDIVTIQPDISKVCPRIAPDCLNDRNSLFWL